MYRYALSTVYDICEDTADISVIFSDFFTGKIKIILNRKAVAVFRKPPPFSCRLIKCTKKESRLLSWKVFLKLYQL